MHQQPSLAQRSGQEVDALSLRSAFSKFATGVTVVGFGSKNEPRGLTVNSFTAVSLDPPLILVSIQKSSRSHDELLNAAFSVSVLRADQELAARAFASRGRIDIPEWDMSGTIPKIGSALAWFE